MGQDTRFWIEDENRRKQDAELKKLQDENAKLRDGLDEIAMNAENLLAGGLGHFSREEFAEVVAWRARHALVGHEEAWKAVNAAKARATVTSGTPKEGP
jgi:hypothetical protein